MVGHMPSYDPGRQWVPIQVRPCSLQEKLGMASQAAGLWGLTIAKFHRAPGQGLTLHLGGKNELSWPSGVLAWGSAKGPLGTLGQHRFPLWGLLFSLAQETAPKAKTLFPAACVIFTI